MEELENEKNFLDYLSTPLSKDNVSLLYAANKIKHERSQVFLDFILTLIKTIQDTYMGDDVTNKDEIPNHFNWAWDKTISGFKEEGINFKDTDILKDYFSNFMMETFYSAKDKNPNSPMNRNLLKLWNYIFSPNTIKTQSDIDTFLELYDMFEKSL